MKKHVTLFCAMVTFITLHAQTTITNTSAIGYTAPLMIASASTAATVPVNTSGAAVTWNCANLQQEAGTPTINYTVSSPTGTAYASDYPKANWYFTDPALTAVFGHHYYSLTADSLVLWGEHTAGKDYDIYDDPQIDLKLPFSYSNTYANSYSKTSYKANGSVSSSQTGTVTLTYDSYGTLILPNGTFTNVARIKKERTNSLGPTTVSYTWYSIATGAQLMNYGTNGGLQVVYNNVASTGINNIQSNDYAVQLFPNPFHDYATLKITSNNTINNGQLIIFNILGQPIKTLKVINNEVKIERDNLPTGIYFYSLMDNNQLMYSQKLIIE
ncbi:MAG: T9SS type A sorting domain-containing protein [Bacteroidota bacterium]